MKNEETVIVDISTLSECETDVKYIRDIKRQAFLLAFLGLLLFIASLEIKFNQGEMFEFFINQSTLQHPSIFFVFLIASFGNLIASRILYYEARNEEIQLKKLKEAFIANAKAISE